MPRMKEKQSEYSNKKKTNINGYISIRKEGWVKYNILTCIKNLYNMANTIKTTNEKNKPN